ncbi:hypothetical protein BDA99DRAFT_542974 [Phascolomyces articulosus]|uniref:Uncharacterized protein n=1 Tax=Phascolomyces articulosus TaxID=60185 RepID=A0AAD5JYU0_9FUNG|nr:hypothetical protein BDA99DRAFT_542974 [Phascolomyces articulosus]
MNRYAKLVLSTQRSRTIKAVWQRAYKMHITLIAIQIQSCTCDETIKIYDSDILMSKISKSINSYCQFLCESYYTFIKIKKQWLSHGWNNCSWMRLSRAEIDMFNFLYGNHRGHFFSDKILILTIIEALIKNSSVLNLPAQRKIDIPNCRTLYKTNDLTKGISNYGGMVNSDCGSVQL